MHGDPFYSYRLRRSVLLVHLDLLDERQRPEAVVAKQLAEDGVQAVEVRRFVQQDEELAAVGPGSPVGHAHDAPLVVAQRAADLVFKRRPKDGPSALGVLGGGVCRRAGLDHERGDQPVKGRVIVVIRCTECEEILASRSLVSGKDETKEGA